MKPRTFRRPAVLLLVLHLQACVSWRPGPLPAEQLLRGESTPDAVRVTTTDGVTRVLDDPVVMGDVLWTEQFLRVCPPDSPIQPCRTTHVDGVPVTPVALDDITLVEVKKFNPIKTVGGLALAVVGALAFIVVAASATGDATY